MHIRRSDIEWRRLRRLIGKNVVIVKKVWEFVAQPSAQRTLENLLRAIVVGPWSKNHNKAHVSWVSFTIISTLKPLLLWVGLAKIYTEASSPHVLIMGVTNSGCRQFWMPPFLDASSCGCCQFRMPLLASSCGCLKLWMLPILDVASCECYHLVRLLIVQPIPKCLTIVLDYCISNHSRDIARVYRLPHQKAQQYLASMAIIKSERLLRKKLRKRRTNLFKKANEIARMTNSKIYVIV